MPTQGQLRSESGAAGFLSGILNGFLGGYQLRRQREQDQAQAKQQQFENTLAKQRQQLAEDRFANEEIRASQKAAADRIKTDIVSPLARDLSNMPPFQTKEQAISRIGQARQEQYASEQSAAAKEAARLRYKQTPSFSDLYGTPSQRFSSAKEPKPTNPAEEEYKMQRITKNLQTGLEQQGVGGQPLEFYRTLDEQLKSNIVGTATQDVARLGAAIKAQEINPETGQPFSNEDYIQASDAVLQHTAAALSNYALKSESPEVQNALNQLAEVATGMRPRTFSGLANPVTTIKRAQGSSVQFNEQTEVIPGSVVALTLGLPVEDNGLYSLWDIAYMLSPSDASDPETYQKDVSDALHKVIQALLPPGEFTKGGVLTPLEQSQRREAQRWKEISPPRRSPLGA